MSSESPKPPIPESLETKEQTLTDLQTMEDMLEEAKRLKDNLRDAIVEENVEKQEEITKELENILSKCHSIKRKIEGKSTEIIEGLDIEKKIEYFISFYKAHSIETPPDFSETMVDIWNRNADEIQEEIKQNGFNTILLIPETLPNLIELNSKMSEGYKPTYEYAKIKDIQESTNKARIVLVHSQELWEDSKLKETLNKKIETFLSQNESLTLSDYLVLQRIILEQTSKHIDTKHTNGFYYWTALPGSKVPNSDGKGGFRVVCAYWDPVYSQLGVSAYDPVYSDPALGCRLSRSFF